jgi:GTP-binding protein HflX
MHEHTGFNPPPGAGRLHELASKTPQAFLVGTYEGGRAKEASEEQLRELKSLGDTYGLITVETLAVPLREIESATFIGRGKVEEIRERGIEKGADLFIFDDELSPQQQRNLEKALGKPVVDRAELILGVFAQRAHTKEARIQVELAASRYQLPRLARLWTHLGRQRTGGSGKSGGGFLKGEGEKQIEIDRRILRRRIDQLQRELNAIKKHRDIQRRARHRSQIPTFAIIGYTNVGKSTLLKALTEAEVLVEDKLFATLDTTTRKYLLPNRQEILLIDTVGFIRKLPHLLVAAFKSTLEEAAEADILLHLVDVSSPQAALQAETTLEVLKELGAHHRPILMLLNKVDQCQGRLPIEKMKITYPKTIEISALKKEGLELLQDRMMQEIQKLRKKISLRVPQSQYALVSDVMKEGKIFSLEYEDNDVLLEVEIPLHLEKKVSHFEVGV